MYIYGEHIMISKKAKQKNWFGKRKEVFDSMNKIMTNLLDTNLRGTWVELTHNIGAYDLQDDEKFSELMGNFYGLILNDILYNGGTLFVDDVESADIDGHRDFILSDYIRVRLEV